MKVSRVRMINAVVWFVVTVALMVLVGKEWSRYGEYTALSFVSSLVFHGGFCAVIGFLCDEQIVKHFNCK